MEVVRRKIGTVLQWSSLAWFDVLSKYRKTVLGPFWITISMGVSVAVLGGVYSRILGQDLSFFVPYLAIGLVGWGFMNSVLQEAPLTFPSSRHVILNMPVAVENIVLRMVLRNFIVMLHNAIILVPVALLFDISFGAPTLIALLGLFFWLVFVYSSAVMLGLLGARFRDVGPTVSAIMGMLFLVTPIIWKADQMQFIADLNPFYYLLECVRGPLLLQVVDPKAIQYSALIALVSSLLAFWCLRRYRRKVVFWI